VASVGEIEVGKYVPQIGDDEKSAVDDGTLNDNL
jgi:hypothetical protein